MILTMGNTKTKEGADFKTLHHRVNLDHHMPNDKMVFYLISAQTIVVKWWLWLRHLGINKDYQILSSNPNNTNLPHLGP